MGTLLDCLDHVIVFGEGHLRRVLREYIAYYHGSRTHLGLGKDAPEPRAIQHQMRATWSVSLFSAACIIATGAKPLDEFRANPEQAKVRRSARRLPRRPDMVASADESPYFPTYPRVALTPRSPLNRQDLPTHGRMELLVGIAGAEAIRPSSRIAAIARIGPPVAHSVVLVIDLLLR